MPLPRLQLFEFNDSAWAPRALRETIVESLSRSLRWGHVLEGLVAPFAEFLEASGTREVLDLCAGAGGPAEILADEMARAGRPPPRFLLSDLHPNVPAWERLRTRHPGVLDFAPEPVDATNVPPALARGRGRLIINALHHFPPELARGVLRDAGRDSPGLFVAEGLVRSPLRFAAFVGPGVPALLLNPLLTERDHLQKALLTWASPLALAASLWDGTVSTLRIYAPDELRALVSGWGDTWDWRSGEFRYGALGRGTWFWGVPRR